MADNRKRLQLRRLLWGGRIRPSTLLLGAALALCGAPAHAQDGALKTGAASLSAGKYDAAVRQLSAAINSSGISPGQAAKALYLRGIAYRKLGQPGRAVSDLGAAIWLGLPADDRVKAQVNRGLAYKAAGLSSQAEAEFSQARKAGGSGEVARLMEQDGGATAASTASIGAFDTAVRSESDGPRAASVAISEPGQTRTAATAPGSWDTSVTSGAQTPSGSSGGGNRLTRFWDSVTGSSDAPAAAPAAAPAPAPERTTTAPQRTTVAAAPKAAAPTTGWTATTDSAATASDAGGRGSGWRLFSRSAEADPTPAPAATRASSSGGGGSYRLQFAATKSEAEANALWKKVSRENSQVGALQPRIKKSEIGSFGTFYHLTVGPFSDKAETVKACNALKRKGVDCFLEGSEEQ